MMRWFIFLGCLALAGCDCERVGKVEPDGLSVQQTSLFPGGDVRCYDVEPELLLRILNMNRPVNGNPDPFAEAGEALPMDDPDSLFMSEYYRSIEKEAIFESRFLEGTNELLDCWQAVLAIVGYDDFEGKAVYDVKNGKLVVKGELGLHRALRHTIENEMQIQLRTTFSVYELPGVGLEDRSGFWSEVPKEAKLLRELSCLSLPAYTSQAGSADGSIWAESELQIDAYDSYVELRATLGVELPEGGFLWKTGFTGIIGMRWAQEVGSLDGKTTLMMMSQVDQIRTNGELWDEWVLKEEGAFMHEERLEVIRPWTSSKVPGDKSGKARMFIVPQYFERMFGVLGSDPDPQDEDPFAASDHSREKFLPIRELLEQNGITFREGDSVSFLRSSSTLVAKLSDDNLELLDGLMHSAIGQGPPQVWSVELAEIEGDDFRKGKMLKKVVLPLATGATATMVFEGLEIEAATDLDSNQELVKLELKLAEEDGGLEKAGLITWVTIRVGKPTVLRRTLEDGKYQSWVATVRVKTLENEVDDFLKQREGEE